MIEARIVNLDTLMVRLNLIPRSMESSVEDVMRVEVESLRQAVIQRMRILFKSSARMEKSLSTEVVNTPPSIEGTVTASGLPYLKIQEYGGVTPPHVILPVRATMLSFLLPGAVGFSGMAGQARIFTKKVNHPGSRMPERSYMRSALAMRRNQIVAAFQAAMSAQAKAAA